MGRGRGARRRWQQRRRWRTASEACRGRWRSVRRPIEIPGTLRREGGGRVRAGAPRHSRATVSRHPHGSRHPPESCMHEDRNLTKGCIIRSASIGGAEHCQQQDRERDLQGVRRAVGWSSVGHTATRVVMGSPRFGPIGVHQSVCEAHMSYLAHHCEVVGVGWPGAVERVCY